MLSCPVHKLFVVCFSDGHEFNWATMDVGHTVNHLSFGPFLSETAWAVIPPDVAQSVGSLDDKAFTSEVSLLIPQVDDDAVYVSCF